MLLPFRETLGTDGHGVSVMSERKVYSCQLDIGSAGCAIYQMPVGYDRNFTSIDDIIHNNHLSKGSKDLLKRMLDSIPATATCMTAKAKTDHDIFKERKQLTLATRRILQGTRAAPVINEHKVQDPSYIGTRGCKERRIDPEGDKGG